MFARKQIAGIGFDGRIDGRKGLHLHSTNDMIRYRRISAIAIRWKMLGSSLWES
jgi:hypothetical protein